MEASALNAHAPAVAVRPPGRVLGLRLRSDEQLLALFRRGNDDAFTVLVDRYRTRLLAYTRRMLGGSQQDAEDALQDVFLRAYGALRADDRPVSVRAWLYRVAHNRCIDQIRRAGPAPEDVFAASRGVAEYDPESALERREDLRNVVADIGDLPQAQRSALLLREIDGLSYNELADALDMTLPAVKSVLVRARTSLAESSEARATPCHTIRIDLDAACDAGVRPDGRAKRHMRECDPCRAYHAALKGRSGSHAGGPLGFLAKLLGLGSAPVSGGAAFGGMATTKVAALVCCGMVAVGAGAVAELPRQIDAIQRQAAAAAPSDAHATGGASRDHALTRALHFTAEPAAAAVAATTTRGGARVGSGAGAHRAASAVPAAPRSAGVVQLRTASGSSSGAHGGTGRSGIATAPSTTTDPSVGTAGDATTSTPTAVGADGRPTTGSDPDGSTPATTDPSSGDGSSGSGSAPTDVGSDGRPIPPPSGGTGSGGASGDAGSSSSGGAVPVAKGH